MQELLSFFDRSIYWVSGGQESPAVYFINDHEAGGILVNAPCFSAALLDELSTIAVPHYLFLPSRRGAQDLRAWQEAGVKLVAYGHEGRGLGVEMDVELDSKTRFTRTIDFLPMSGRTAGSCALRLKNKPGVIFFGPILEPGEQGWPTLRFHDDDHSSESRLFGVLGLQDVHFEYAFTDGFVPGESKFGPMADKAIQAEINRVLET